MLIDLKILLLHEYIVPKHFLEIIINGIRIRNKYKNEEYIFNGDRRLSIEGCLCNSKEKPVIKNNGNLLDFNYANILYLYNEGSVTKLTKVLKLDFNNNRITNDNLYNSYLNVYGDTNYTQSLWFFRSILLIIAIILLISQL